MAASIPTDEKGQGKDTDLSQDAWMVIPAVGHLMFHISNLHLISRVPYICQMYLHACFSMGDNPGKTLKVIAQE